MQNQLVLKVIDIEGKILSPCRPINKSQYAIDY